VIRYCFSLLFCALLLVSCSKRERSDSESAEWAEIEAMADHATVVPASGTSEPKTVPNLGMVEEGEFGPFFERLAAMKTIDRGVGETLLTGKSMVLDHEQRFVRMDQNVVVEDDQGILKTQSLIGRFSISNEVEFVEAQGGVELVSSNRTATAETAIYNYRSGFVQLEGLATASDGGNRLSGERIRFWVEGDRKMVCEPNALLEIARESGLPLDGVGASSGELTEVRADRAVYDESTRTAELFGHVRVRDPQAAMNCDTIRIYLKEGNEIDWIEAIGEVIIQSDDRKALAERATYTADEGKFALEGDPKVKQGLNVMTGDRIEFWHESRRMVCEPNARVLLHLDEETKAKFLKDLDD
jgi:lipopolysaccharide export system protein LptA